MKLVGSQKVVPILWWASQVGHGFPQLPRMAFHFWSILAYVGPGLPEALLGNCFATDRGCGSCLSLGCPDLSQPYRELCLFGSMGLLPQDAGLLVKELIQGG